MEEFMKLFHQHKWKASGADKMFRYSPTNNSLWLVGGAKICALSYYKGIDGLCLWRS